MDPLILLLIGSVAAGFVAGLTGLGTAMTALTFWLYAVSPSIAVPLALLLSCAVHVMTMTLIRHGIVWPRLWPFILGGMIGLPLGVLLLPYLDNETAKLGLGVFLVVYCAYGLLVRRPPVFKAGGRPADAAVGAVGGTLGGLAGLSGPIPTIWTGLRGWPKDESRGVYQPFNLAILAAAAVGHGLAGRYQALDPLMILKVLGGGLIGAAIGFGIYRRTSDKGFRRVLLLVLLVAGMSHILSFAV